MGPLHFLREFGSRVNPWNYVRFSHLTRLRFVGLLPCVIIDKIRLISVKILIQSYQCGALHFLRDIVPQYGQVRQSIAGIAVPQLPCGALS